MRKIVYTEARKHQSRSGLHDFFDAANNTIFQHDFDAMRMSRRFCEDSLDDAFGQLSGALVLLFDNPDSHAGLNIGS